MSEHRVEIRIVDGSDAWEGIKAEATRLNLSTNNVCQILCIQHFENKYRTSQGLEPNPSVLSSPIIPVIQTIATTKEVIQEEETDQGGLEAIMRAIQLNQNLDK